MKLSEKIQALRKLNGYSQETLAEKCNVSRQAISKWEADIALPETEKLLVLSKLFGVSVDVLLKDDLLIDVTKESHTCGSTNNSEKEAGIYEGLMIKESIEDELILDYISINKVEVWKTDGRLKYWTALYFTSSQPNFPDLLSKVIIADENRGGNWYVDMKQGNTKLIVFKNKILRYQIGNTKEKEQVCEECRKLGIPDRQLDWTE